MKYFFLLLTASLVLSNADLMSQPVVLDFENGWPTEIVYRNTDASIDSAGCSPNHYLELSGNGNSAGGIVIGPLGGNTQGLVITFKACDEQPGNSGKLDVMEYTSLPISLGGYASSQPIQNIATGTCPTSIYSVTLTGSNTRYIGFQKKTGSSVYLRIDDISSPIPLPVELVSFHAYQKTDKEILVRWSTATELNSASFTLERSLDQERWHNVGTLPAAGNSASPKQYEMRDVPSANGLDIFYRLLMLDRDGSYEYSHVLKVSTLSSQSVYYPNPFSESLSLNIRTKTSGELRIELWDLLGQLVRLLHQGEVLGNTTLSFNTSAIQRGTYMLVIHENGSPTQYMRIIK